MRKRLATDKSDSQGAYAIDSAVTGSFQIRLTAPSGVTATAPTNGIRSISPVAGQPLPNLDFGVNFATTWQNILNAFDVDNDGSVRILDALSILQDMTANGARLLTTLGANAPLPANFFDVTGDGRLTARDILLVIEEITRLTSAPTAEPGSKNAPAANGFVEAESFTFAQDRTIPSIANGENGLVPYRSTPAPAPAEAVDAWASWYGQTPPAWDASTSQNGGLGKPRRRL